MRNKSNEICIAIISIIEKVIGLSKTLLFSYFYGTSNISDAFNIILTIPDTIFSLVGNGINSSYIPLISTIKNDKVKNCFTSEIATIIVSITSVICIISMPFTNFIVHVFAPGFDYQTAELTKMLISISIWSVIFSSISAILASYLQIKGRFASSSFTYIILNICQCIAIILSAFFSNLLLAFGILAGSIVQTLILLSLAAKVGYNLTFSIPQKENIKRIFYLSIPIMLGASANRINIIIDKAIASSVIEGGISALSYADSLILFIKAVFATPIITVVFPQIAISTANKSRNKTKKIISDAFEKMSFYLVPITFGSMALSKQVVKIVYQRGVFNSDSVIATSACLKWYSVGLIAFCFRDLFVKIHYADKNTKSPAINMIIGIVINIILNIMFSRLFGIKGLAMASSLSAYIIAGLMAISLKNLIHIQEYRETILKILKMLIASIIMFLEIKTILFIEFLAKYILLQTILCVFAGFFTYSFLLVVFRTYSKYELIKRIIMK